MSFVFTKIDLLHDLHSDLRDYMPNFIENRFKEFKELESAVRSNDIKSIRDYCHKQKGVAASYKCFKLEEVTDYMHKFALEGEITPIKEVLPILKTYLDELHGSI